MRGLGWIFLLGLVPLGAKEPCYLKLSIYEVLKSDSSRAFIDLVKELKTEGSAFRESLKQASYFGSMAGDPSVFERAMMPFIHASAAHLKSQGVDFKQVGNDFIILPSEATELNRSAATIQKKYDTELRFSPARSLGESFNGAFEVDSWSNKTTIYLGTDAVFNPHQKDIIVAHEAGHARTHVLEREGKSFAYYGSIEVPRYAQGTFPKIGEKALYPRYMSFDEFNNFYSDFLRRTRRGEKLESFQDSGISALAKYQHLEQIYQRIVWLNDVVKNNQALEKTVTQSEKTGQWQMKVKLPLDGSGNTFELTLPLIGSSGVSYSGNDLLFQKQLELLMNDVNKKWAFAQRVYQMRRDGIHLMAGDSL